MKPKLILCLALLFSGGLFGCLSPNRPMSKPTTDNSRARNPDHSAAPTREDDYAAVTNAINREDWDALRRLAKPGMRANEYITMWENSAKAGHPLRVGKFFGIGEESKYPLDGKPCTMYTFQLESKDGTPSPHDLQVLVRNEGGKSVILDFWNFGW
jgi:hypothetical protein